MPELPDITIYIEALEKRILGRKLEKMTIVSPFLLRTVKPPIESAIGKNVVELRRLGKRICIGMEGGTWLVLHLMIAGRLHWKERALSVAAQDGQNVAATTVSPDGIKLGGRQNLAALAFANGTLVWTEAGTQKRASLHLAAGEEGLRELDPGGLEVLKSDSREFARVLLAENHTLKRALTDPTLFSGIGNAYSDEILWEAKLSPLALTQKISAEAIQRLYEAARRSLKNWTERLREETGNRFPEKVTAFRPEMAMHGKFGQACPRCGGKVQRIRHAENETNYCPTCQTGGKLLADRAISRLLREDWPKTPEEMELRMKRKREVVT